MKFIIALVALFAIACAAPPAQNVQVLRSESDVGIDHFSHSLETDDGTKINAAGQLKNAGTDNEAIVVQGSYRFVADDGQTYEVTYVADENGFQPQGAHLPVAPQA